VAEAAIIQPTSRPEFDWRIEHGRQIIDAAFDKSVLHSMPAGARIFAPGGSRDLVYRLTHGWAYRAVHCPDGRRAIVEIYLPGDHIGFEAVMLDRPNDEAVAVTALAAQAIDIPTLTQLMASPPAAVAVSALLVEEQRRLLRLAAALACGDAHERLALMLTDLYDRLYRRDLITSPTYALPLTQQQIGDYLGLNPIHVNRVLRSLREKEIVSIDHRMVMIRNLKRLRQLAAGGTTEQCRATEPPRDPREPVHARRRG
jgi:CRP-like cAMP-binding protein